MNSVNLDESTAQLSTTASNEKLNETSLVVISVISAGQKSTTILGTETRSPYQFQSSVISSLFTYIFTLNID